MSPHAARRRLPTVGNRPAHELPGGAPGRPLRRRAWSRAGGGGGDVAPPDDPPDRRPNRRIQVPLATLNDDAVTTVAAPLTLSDRCDAAAVVGAPNGRTGRGPCGAQGFVRAVLPGGNDLVFC